MKCQIILKSQVNCVITGLDNDTINFFNEKFMYEVPGARFTAKVQLGIWDGKISYFKKNGETFIYLLKDIVLDLKYIGYDIEVKDLRKISNIKFEPIDENYFKDFTVPNRPDLQVILRDYQVEAANAILTNHIGIVLAGTGAGKTLITSVICDVFNKKGLKVLVIVPSVSLVKQTFNYINHFNIDAGQVGGKIKDPNHQTVVSTWQTLQNIPILIKDFDMVLIDECHGLKGQVLNNLLGEYGEHIYFRYGLTATLPKEEIHRIMIHNVVGEPLYEIPSHELIKRGHLAKVKITIKQINENLKEQYQVYSDNFIDGGGKKLTYKGFKNSYFPDYNAEKRFLKTDEKRLDKITQYIIDTTLEGNSFVLVDGIAFGKKLVKLIKEKSTIEHVYFLHGDDSADKRQEIFDMFDKNDNIVVIATVNIAAVGIDIPRIFYLLMVDIGKSYIRVLQSIGRGLRLSSDKEYIDVYDVCSDFKYSKRHLTDRVKYYKEAQYPYEKEVIDFYE